MVTERHTSPLPIVAVPQVPLAVRVAVPTTVVPTSMFIDDAEAAGTIASAATKTKARIESLRLVILTKSPFERT
jgi:hypothetical protein